MWYKGLFVFLLMATMAMSAPLADPPDADRELLPQSLSQMQHSREISMVAAMEEGITIDTTKLAKANQPNIGKALLLSAIVPGTGQFYLGEKWKGWAFLGVEAAAWTLSIMYNVQGTNADHDFKKFVDTHWNESLYRQREYYYATLDTLPTRQSTVPYVGDTIQWRNLPWSEKTRYLPSNYTHELPGSRDQQFYEMVGKYLTQFGFAWDDAVTSDSTGGIWRGSSYSAVHYEDMRYKSNQLLKKGNAFLMVAMVNHVLSVTDAIITIKMLKNKQVETAWRVEQRNINNETVTMPTLYIKF